MGTDYEDAEKRARAGRITVISCTGYPDRRHPSIHEMEEIAWILRSDPKRKEIGLVRASDLRPSVRYVLDKD